MEKLSTALEQRFHIKQQNCPEFKQVWSLYAGK
jgi:hypothetical protein